MLLKKELFTPLLVLAKYNVCSVLNLQNHTGAPNNGFLSDPLKRYFRLSGVLLKL